MRRLNPLHLGLLEVPLVVSGLAALLAFAVPGIAYPSPELLRSMAEIGVAILLGYVIEVVWMTVRLEREDDDRESWLGSMVGLGLCGLAGIVVALLIAEHRAAGHANLLDKYGLWWATVSLAMLGILVTLQPLIVDRWSKPSSD